MDKKRYHYNWWTKKKDWWILISMGRIISVIKGDRRLLGPPGWAGQIKVTLTLLFAFILLLASLESSKKYNNKI